MQDRMRLALLLGSTRAGRFCDTIAEWAVGEISNYREFDLDVIDPAGLELPRIIEATDGPAVKALAQRIGEADAFVVISPEYNHGYPAALKDLIDSAYSEWNAKPVAFISYGGMAGGVRAVEQLRQVFAELHAVTVRDTVSFANPWDSLDEAGKLARADRAAEALSRMLSQLRWWAGALKRARAAEPYLRAAG